MPSDEQNTSVPSDAPQPVRPASRVRALLGLLDDADENLVLSPPAPPVGFRYVEDPFIGEPDPIELPLTEHRPRDDLGEENPFSPPTREVDVGTSDVSGRAPSNVAAAETRQYETSARHIASQPGTAPPEHPVATPQQTHLEVPSVFDRPTAFPTLSDEIAAEQTVDTPKPRVPAVLPPPAARSQPDVLPESQSKPPLAAETSSVTSEHPIDTSQQTGLEIPGVSARPTFFPVLADETAAAQAPDRALSSIAPAAKAPMIPPVRTSERPPQRVGTDSERLTGTSSQQPPEQATTGGGQAVSRAEDAPRNNGFSLGPSRSVAVSTGRMSDRNTADERIEHLQQTVYELTSKLLSLQAQVNHQAQREQRHAERAHPERSASRSEPTPPPPSPPVVIIKRSSPQDRPTHAFWARRYLGRLHRRPLR